MKWAEYPKQTHYHILGFFLIFIFFMLDSYFEVLIRQRIAANGLEGSKKLKVML